MFNSGWNHCFIYSYPSFRIIFSNNSMFSDQRQSKLWQFTQDLSFISNQDHLILLLYFQKQYSAAIISFFLLIILIILKILMIIYRFLVIRSILLDCNLDDDQSPNHIIRFRPPSVQFLPSIVSTIVSTISPANVFWLFQCFRDLQFISWFWSIFVNLFFILRFFVSFKFASPRLQWYCPYFQYFD